jgi:hypothetical protein
LRSERRQEGQDEIGPLDGPGRVVGRSRGHDPFTSGADIWVGVRVAHHRHLPRRQYRATMLDDSVEPWPLERGLPCGPRAPRVGTMHWRM